MANTVVTRLSYKLQLSEIHGISWRETVDGRNPPNMYETL